MTIGYHVFLQLLCASIAFFTVTRVAFYISGLVNKKQTLIIENRFIVFQNISNQYFQLIFPNQLLKHICQSD